MALTRTHKRVNPDLLQETMQELGVSAGGLSELLGMAPNFVSACLRRGDAPAWVEPACHGLRELARDRDAERPAVIVVQPDPAKRDGLVAVLDAMGVPYAQVQAGASAVG